MKIINPATEEVISEVQSDTVQTLAEKFGNLRKSQMSWTSVSLADRVKAIERFRDILERDEAVLAILLTSEVGKPLAQSHNEIRSARSRIDWLAANASKYLSDEWMVEGREKIVYEALGVVCNISAWNYPYLVGVNVFIPALLAGNAVMYKPSEYATLTGKAITDRLKEAGIPPSVLEVATGGPEVGKALLEMEFDGYFFTGSYKTGLQVYETVSKKMVPCQCELGGKDPLYVADDVIDILKVAEATADGAFYNNGQSCCAVERIYVHEGIYDEYISGFLKTVKGWKVGGPLEPDVYFGPLTRKEQLHVLEQQVEEAVTLGANVLTGGNRISGKGYYFQPTVLTNVTNDMQVMREESFGPVIGIMKVRNDQEAIRLMSDTAYGLTAAVFTADRGRAERILKDLNTGSAYWNCCDRVSAALPWSGRLHSGFGSTLSHAGLRAFVHPKGFHLNPGV